MKKTSPPQEAPPRKAGRPPGPKAAEPGRFAGLGAALRMLRRKRNLRVKQIAEQVGVAPSVVSRWETGKLVPTLDSLGRLGDQLGLHFGDLDDLVTTATGRPRRPRPFAPPRNAAEIDALADELSGPTPIDEEKARLHAALRPILQRVLYEVAVANGMPRE